MKGIFAASAAEARRMLRAVIAWLQTDHTAHIRAAFSVMPGLDAIKAAAARKRDNARRRAYARAINNPARRRKKGRNRP